MIVQKLYFYEKFQQNGPAQRSQSSGPPANQRLPQA